MSYITPIFKAIAIALLLVTSNLSVTTREVPSVTPEQCSAANIFFEARGESLYGMQAVAEVVNNRTTAKGFPSEVCLVVFQARQFSWTHQQDFGVVLKVLQGDLSGFTLRDRSAYQMAITAACRAVKTHGKVLPAGTLWYHTKEVKPLWVKSLRKVKIIENHVFYAKSKV